MAGRGDCWKEVVRIWCRVDCAGCLDHVSLFAREDLIGHHVSDYFVRGDAGRHDCRLDCVRLVYYTCPLDLTDSLDRSRPLDTACLRGWYRRLGHIVKPRHHHPQDLISMLDFLRDYYLHHS